MGTDEPSAGAGQRARNIREYLKPGSNCWKLEEARRLAVLVDTADYFAAFAEPASRRTQILILGWDFDRHERLHRDEPAGAAR